MRCRFRTLSRLDHLSFFVIGALSLSATVARADIYCTKNIRKDGGTANVVLVKGTNVCPPRIPNPFRPEYLDFVRGEKGDVGPVGPSGATGPMGPQGLKGDRGLPGQNGATGPTGATGATGPMGPQGLKGDRGLPGQNGATGPTGPQGPIGPIGPVGPQGPLGPQGIQGPAGPPGDAALSVTYDIAGTTTSPGCLQVEIPGEMCVDTDGCRMVVTMHEQATGGLDRVRGLWANLYFELFGISPDATPGVHLHMSSSAFPDVAVNIATNTRHTLVDYRVNTTTKFFQMTNYIPATCPGQTTDGPAFVGTAATRVNLWVPANILAVVKFTD